MADSIMLQAIPLTEAQIRAALIAKLTTSTVGAGAAFISEMFLDGFSRRADLVMANGKLSAFEIKSGRDSLDRLAGQLDSYLRHFEIVTVVCAGRHLDGVVKIAPSTVGIWSVADDGSLLIERRARMQRLKSANSWLSFLPVDELRALLRANGLKTSGTRDELAAVVQSVALESLRAFVLHYLKRRSARIQTFIAKRQQSRTATGADLARVAEERLKDFIGKACADMKPIPRLRAVGSTI